MTQAEIKRAIHAFNERLRQAEADYGADSAIVDKMRETARFYLDLQWTKKNGKDYRISSKSEIKDMMQFEKFVLQNNAPKYIKDMLTEEMKEEAKNFKGQARKDYIRDAYQHVNAVLSLLDHIWLEVYDETGNTETATMVYDLAKAKQYIDIFYEYYNGDIGIRELVDKLLSAEDDRLYGEYEEWTDEDFEALKNANT